MLSVFRVCCWHSQWRRIGRSKCSWWSIRSQYFRDVERGMLSQWSCTLFWSWLVASVDHGDEEKYGHCVNTLQLVLQQRYALSAIYPISQAEYWHFGADPCIVELQSFFCIFEWTISICLRISWRSMPKPCGFFKIQDGRQDGRRITKNAITFLIIDLELRIWCLLVCFV